MTYNLVMNSNSVVQGSSNTRYSYAFHGGSFDILDDAELCVSNITMPYSWFNVSKAYQNLAFSITWDIAGTPTTIPLTLQEGFYTITDLNAAIQQLCILNGLYLINTAGNYIYYLTLLYNASTYGVQLVCSLVPSSLPAGWTQPPGFIGYPNVPSTPCLVLVSSSTLYQILGFANGASYPPTPSLSPISYLSAFTPLGSNVNSLIIRCNLVSNEVGFPSDILDTMPITSTFGSNINYSPPALKWVKVSSGTYQKLEIQFVDQNLNSMTILDNNVCISLLLKNKGEAKKELFIEAPSVVDLGSSSMTERSGPKLIFRD